MLASVYLKKVCKADFYPTSSEPSHIILSIYYILLVAAKCFRQHIHMCTIRCQKNRGRFKEPVDSSWYFSHAKFLIERAGHFPIVHWHTKTSLSLNDPFCHSSVPRFMLIWLNLAIKHQRCWLKVRQKTSKLGLGNDWQCFVSNKMWPLLSSINIRDLILRTPLVLCLVSLTEKYIEQSHPR